MNTSAEAGATGTTFTLALIRAAVNAFKQIVTALRHRGEVRSLYALDDRALKDIGLVRTDVTAALGAPLHFDPSRHLVEVTGGPRPERTPVVAPLATTPLRRPVADVKGLARA